MNHLRCYLFYRDRDYIPEIQSGGERGEVAMSCLYLKYRKRTYTYMHHLISRHPQFKGTPDDLIHDAFIIMLDKIRQDALDVKSLGGYWIGISKMLFLNQLKKDRRIVVTNDLDETYGYEFNTPESILFDQEEHYALENAFGQLGPRCREILMLWIHEYSMVEIAKKMNLSSDAMARKIKFDCFNKLKQLVKDGNTSFDL